MSVARRTVGGLHHPVTLPVLAAIGMAVSVATFLLVHHVIRSGWETHVTRTAEQYHQALKERLDAQNLFLHALAGRFSGAPPAIQADFSAAVARLRPFSPALESVAWLRGPVIAFLDPASPTPPGLDSIRPGNGLNATPSLTQAVERACAENRIVSVPAGALSDPPHYAVLMPVSQAAGPADGGHACAAFDGVLLALFNIGRLLDDALDTQPPLNADLYLVETRGNGTLTRLAVRPAPRRHEGFIPVDDGILAAALPTALPLAAGSGTWQMVLLPQAAPLFGDGFGVAWSVLAGGVLLTGVMLAYLYREARARIMLQTEARARAAMARMLRESEERFRLALRHSKVSVFSQDRRLRYIWIYNPQIAVAPGRFLSRTDADLFTDDTAAVMEAIKQEVMDSGIGMRREVTAVPRDPDTGTSGAGHVFDLVVEPLRDGSTTIVGVICAAVDVTEAALLRDALADAHAEAQRANQAKTRFLAAASHDLRQPFQAMSLFHHILMARLDDPTLRDVAAKLGEAMTAGSALLNALLDTSALEAGTIKPRLEDFPFQAVALRLGTEIAGQAASKGLTLRTAATSALVRSDPVLLERLLRNLLLNALRYTRTGRILLGCRRRGDRLLVQVGDTGPGIPAAQLERIFDDFFRGDSGTEDGGNGLGLGLATVRRMALLLDHPVSVRSVEGHGTLFSVSIPLAPAHLRNRVAAMQ